MYWHFELFAFDAKKWKKLIKEENIALASVSWVSWNIWRDWNHKNYPETRPVSWSRISAAGTSAVLIALLRCSKQTNKKSLIWQDLQDFGFAKLCLHIKIAKWENFKMEYRSRNSDCAWIDVITKIWMLLQKWFCPILLRQPKHPLKNYVVNKIRHIFSKMKHKS